MVALVANPKRFAERVRDFHSLCVTKSNLSRLAACDILQAIPQTEVWIAVQSSGDNWAVGPAKFCGHELPRPEDYPSERVGMRAGEASRLARRWGKMVLTGHPAYAEVERVAQSLGATTRRKYSVVVLNDGTTVHAPCYGREQTLAELVAGITDENRHDPADFGPPVGHEAW